MVMNQEKRQAIIAIGVITVTFNAICFNMWLFDPPENKPVILAIWATIDVAIFLILTIVAFAHWKFPPKNDD